MDKESIKGHIDESGLIYLNTILINPITKQYSVNLKSVVDTGSVGTLVKREIIDYLGLVPTRVSRFQNPIIGSVEVNMYEVLIELRDKFKLIKLEVYELPHQQYPSDIILGMNILKLFDLHYYSLTESFDLIHT